MRSALVLAATAPLVGAAVGWHLGLVGVTTVAIAAAADPNPVPAPTSRWLAPLAGTLRVTRGFEPPLTLYGPGHRGVDLAGRPGEAVRAAGAGTVGFVGTIAGVGIVTVVHPDGWKTTYEPIAPSVRAGHPVIRGGSLGTLQPGHPGCPVAACLHWGLVAPDGTYRDPLALLGRGPPRLLPLVGPPLVEVPIS